MILRQQITIGVYYYMPDHRSLVQEFYWQTMDVVPQLPRTHKFLNYWKDNIEAVIKEVMICHSNNDWRRLI